MNTKLNETRTEPRKPYVAPEVRVYGDIRSLTAGAGPGNADLALGLGIPGNPGHSGGGGSGGIS